MCTLQLITFILHKINAVLKKTQKEAFQSTQETQKRSMKVGLRMLVSCRSYLPFNEYTGLIRKIPVSCSRFSKQDVNCCASSSLSLVYLSILSPHRWARLFCRDSILSKVENTPSSRPRLCLKLCSKKREAFRAKHKNKVEITRETLI